METTGGREGPNAVGSSSSGNECLDVTVLLEDCASNILSHQDPFLCDQEYFNLHDAMAASQLMDPKMDCCEIPAAAVAQWGDEKKIVFPRPIPSCLQDPLTPLPWENLTVASAAFISIEIIVRLQSLLSGSSVGESVFTCLYAHSAVLADMETRLIPETLCSTEKSLEERFEDLKLNDNHPLAAAQWCVFAVTLGLLEITEMVRMICLNADIYEEEDFASSTHNLACYSSINSGAPQILRTALRILKTLPETDETSLIENCLGFQMDFLTMCSGLSKLTEADLPHALIAAQIKSRGAVSKLKALEQLTGKLVPVSGYAPDVKILLQRCFDSYVTRPLVGNLPIRKIRFQVPREAIHILCAITSEVDTFVCSLLLRGSSLSRIQRMLDRFDRCNILCRSLTVLNLYFNDKLLGQYPLRELVRDQIQRRQAPIPEESWCSSEQAQAFLNRLAKPVYDCLKMRLLNTNRQRAYLEAVLFPEWISLQNEAQMVDLHCHQQQTIIENGSSGSIRSTPRTYFTRYVLTTLIGLMDRYVASGIEVGLSHNSHSDFALAIWYRDFLLNALSQNLTLMRQTKETAARRKPEKSTKCKKKHGKASSNANHDPPPSTAEELEDMLEFSVIALKRNMCRKTMQFRAALMQVGILKEQQFEFTSLERIFEKRFEVFQYIRQPPPLSFAHFLEGSDSSLVQPIELLQTVSEGFQYCRASIEQMLQDMTSYKMDPMYSPTTEAELRSLLKVCIGNAVYVQKLRQLLESGDESVSSIHATLDFETHNQFYIFKLK